ncbi:MAG TPA: ABC transporter permease [Vicinamibacterales bacterium]|nr:ABC transporter permease [Vicinamibacterales bacterium]
MAAGDRMHSVLQDVRFALRGFLGAPGFTAIVLLTLAVGTGANATVFSFVHALLLRPAAGVADPRGLVAAYTSDFSSGPYGSTSYPDYLSLKDDTSAFTALAAYEDRGMAVLSLGEAAERVGVCAVSGTFFEMLGLKPAAGRLIASRDESADAPEVAVIGHELWQRALGGRQEVIGATAKIAGRTVEIVGVAPAGFSGIDLGHPYDVWLPLAPPAQTASARGSRSLSIVGKLRPGVTLPQAQAQASALAARLADQFPATNRGTLRHPADPRPFVVLRHSRLHPAFRDEVSLISGVMMAAVALVLLIACANVGALLLARATSRARELAVRVALGAGRSRLIRQLLVESALLAAMGGALGVLFALWTADALPSFFPPEQARMLAVEVDGVVVAFAAALAGASSLLFGLAPALHAARPGRTSVLAGGRNVGDGDGATRLRRGFVTAQVALAFVLIVCAALLSRSVARAFEAELGFATRHAVLASIELPSAGFTDDDTRAYYAALLESLRSIPGIEEATLARSLALLSSGGRRGFTIPGYVLRPGEGRELHVNMVDGRYFATLGIPLVAGRAFDARDTAGTMRVAIVNDVLARRYFGGRAVGRRMQDSRGTWLEIVGVVRGGPITALRAGPVPLVFYPLSQEPARRISIVARTAGDPGPLVEVVRRQARSVRADVPVFRATTLDAYLGEALAGDRLTAALVTTSALMALLLAVTGVNGVIGYAVTRRTREIGVRVALGARHPDVMRLVASEAMPVATGIAVGAAAAIAASRALRSLLFGVGAGDPASFAMAAVLLLLAALLAAWLPARRALGLDPAAVLRQD